MRKAVIFIFVLSVMVSACKKSLITGPVNQNLPPETHTVIDTIIRLGADRLTSSVSIQWWGDDSDGFVAGFEYTFDDLSASSVFWNPIASNDSTFLLSPPPGMDTIDFRFSVRAIDNKGLADPSPASVSYPVKNSPPSISFIPGANSPVRSFPILRFNWLGADPDGFENLDYYELAWNDSNQATFKLPVSINGAIFSASDPMSDTSSILLYFNNNTQPEQTLMHGMQMNDTNRLFIRVVDRSKAISNWVASPKVYLKKINSNILLVNAYTSGTQAIEQFYADGLINQGIQVFDTLQIFEQQAGEYTQLSADIPTQTLIFNSFKTIIWFGNSAANSLSLAQKTTDNFFTNGGKMMMAVYVSSNFDEQSQFLDFTPINSLVDPVDTTLILNNNALVTPGQSGWPILKSSGIVGIVKPIELAVGVSSLYTADLLGRDEATNNLNPWGGLSTVMAMRQSGGNTNFIMSTLELQGLNANNNIDSLFHQILIQEFGL